MARGCRDCKTCTMPAASRSAMRFGLFWLHFMTTLGISYLVWKSVTRRCPTCTHTLSRHHRRADGSFQD